METYLQKKHSVFKENIKENVLCFPDKTKSLDTFLLHQFHQTGFLYGSPVSLLLNHSFPENIYNKNEELFIYLIDSFFFIWESNKEEADATESNLLAFANSVINFYECVIPRFSQSIKTGNDSFKLLEKTVSSRVDIEDSFVQYNYTGYLYNSLLCVDLLTYSAWLKNSESVTRDYFERILLSFLIIITAAGNADGKFPGNAEKILLGNFIRSLSLKEKYEEIALKSISQEIDKAYYDLLFLPDSVLKIMAYEFALIIILSDAYISDTEKIFSDQLSEKLSITEAEARYCLTRIESFVYHNWDNRVTDDKVSFRFLKNGIQKRIENILYKNKKKLVQEFQESKELLQLLNKYSQQNLTSEEQKKVKEQLLDVLRTIPSLAIFLLPGGAFILPVLLKIIPKEYLLPSSFRESKE